MTAEADTKPAPVLLGEPWCPFCGCVMEESEDGRTLVCSGCRTDALMDGCGR